MNGSERMGGWLLDQLRRAYAGEPWHGDALARLLEDVDADRAAARPLPRAHTIWEIVLHATAWTRETTRRLRGAYSREPLEGDWPAPGETSPARWDAALARLAAAQAELEGEVAALPAHRWDEPLAGVPPEVPANARVTAAQLVIGLVQHHAYHGGQIAVLKKDAG